jgi:hypothetical protein
LLLSCANNSDHYLHHRFFECNYGTVGTPWDVYFGTYRDRLEPGAVASADAKATLLVCTPENPLYLLLAVGLPAWWVAAAMVAAMTITTTEAATITSGATSLLDPMATPHVAAVVVALGPVAAAAALHALGGITATPPPSNFWKHMMAPFDRDSLVVHVFHLGFGGIVLCIVPVYALVATALLPPGEAPACILRSNFC